MLLHKLCLYTTFVLTYRYLSLYLKDGRGERNIPLYEAPFNAVLQSTCKITLFDLYSRDVAAYDEFWNDVPVARRRRPPSSTPWKFSLGECIWMRRQLIHLKRKEKSCSSIDYQSHYNYY